MIQNMKSNGLTLEEKATNNDMAPVERPEVAYVVYELWSRTDGTRAYRYVP